MWFWVHILLYVTGQWLPTAFVKQSDLCATSTHLPNAPVTCWSLFLLLLPPLSPSAAISNITSLPPEFAPLVGHSAVPAPISSSVGVADPMQGFRQQESAFSSKIAMCVLYLMFSDNDTVVPFAFWPFTISKASARGDKMRGHFYSYSLKPICKCSTLLDYIDILEQTSQNKGLNWRNKNWRDKMSK